MDRVQIDRHLYLLTYSLWQDSINLFPTVTKAYGKTSIINSSAGKFTN